MIIFAKNIRNILNKIFAKDRESGNVFVLALLSTSVLIGITGLAIDYGNAVMLEAKLQSATDIATLAGIQEIPFNLSAEGKMAQFIQQNYKYSSDIVTDMNSDDASCWMTASHDVPTYFMRIFGRDTLTIHSNARAILEPVEGISGGPGIMPFVLINPNKNGTPNDDLKEQNNGKPYVLKYGSDNIMVEDWYAGRQTVGSGIDHFQGNLPDGGWRSVLGLDPSSDSPYDTSNSANDFRTNFGEGWDGTVKI
ncbi:MAG: Tad domain-containing protein, partial [bacterium]